MSSATPQTDVCWLSRVKVIQAEAGGRLRYLDNGPHAVTQRDLHYKFGARFTVSLTKSENTYVHVRAETGDSFNNDHNYTAAGLGSRVNTFNVKDIFFGHEIRERAEVQAGGLDYDRGAGSEATYADNDGWLEGYRVVLKGRGASLLPNRLSFTAGYVGDLKQPDFFRRLHRLKQLNYIQILGQKSLGAKTETSAEFTGINGIPFFRAGITRKNPSLRVVDDIILEAIVRTGHNTALGWSSTVSRKLDSPGHWRCSATYSDTPTKLFERKGTHFWQSGDKMSLGKRLGATLYFSPLHDFEVIWFASRRLDATPGTRYRAQLVVRYQLASLLSSLFSRRRALDSSPQIRPEGP